MRHEPGALVLEVVVEREPLPRSVGQLERRVERRSEPARHDLRDDLLAGATIESNTSMSPACWMRPLTMTGSVIFWAAFGVSFDSFSNASGSVSSANGTRLETVAPRCTESGTIEGPAPDASMVNLLPGRFQPMTSTLVFALDSPPSGKMPVTNGNSPIEMR